jgi:hypothetical protein
MTDALIELFRNLVPVLELAIGLVFWKKSTLSYRKLIATAFFINALISFIWRYFSWKGYEGADLWAGISPWLYFAALTLTLVGAARLQSGHYSAQQGAPKIMALMNKYFSTDELISRAGNLPTANDDLEQFKKEWRAALEAFVDEDRAYTSLVDPGKYGRQLILERYSVMGEFDTFPCGQLRSLELAISGPGDGLPWLTVTLRYHVDGVQVGIFTIANDLAIKFRGLPQNLWAPEGANEAGGPLRLPALWPVEAVESWPPPAHPHLPTAPTGPAAADENSRLTKRPHPDANNHRVPRTYKFRRPESTHRFW